MPVSPFRGELPLTVGGFVSIVKPVLNVTIAALAGLPEVSVKKVPRVGGRTRFNSRLSGRPAGKGPDGTKVRILPVTSAITSPATSTSVASSTRSKFGYNVWAALAAVVI